MTKISKEIIVQQYEIDSHDNEKYINHFILDIPMEAQPYAIASVALLLNLYTTSPDNNVNITKILKSGIPEGEHSQKIKSGVIEFNEYLKNHTWKGRQGAIKQHFDQFVCTLSSSSQAQLPRARQA